MEPYMNVRLQTKRGEDATGTMRRGLETLREVCRHVDETFSRETADDDAVVDDETSTKKKKKKKEKKKTTKST